jgi:hypothetical protein
MSFITTEIYWYPQTLHYSSYNNSFPFFVRAAQHKNFNKLSIITGIKSADELREKVKEGCQRLGNFSNFSFHHDFRRSMNLENLDTLK